MIRSVVCIGGATLWCMYRLCTSCGGAAPAGGSCPTCHRSVRSGTQDPFYRTSGWRALRRRQLALHARCQAVADGTRCDQRATDVDHVTPRSEGGADDLANLQSLCHAHHAVKTNAQRAARRGGERHRYKKRATRANADAHTRP